MEKVNNLVKGIQQEEKGSIAYEMAYADLFNIVMVETINPKVNSFSRQIKGDIAEGVAVGTELLIELVNKWDGTGNFHTLFKASLDNRLINLVHSLGRDIRKHNTSYDISLSETAKDDDGSSPILEVLNDENLVTGFNIADAGTTLNEMLDAFEKKHPMQAGLINIMLNFSDDAKQSEKTEAYCGYYGVDSYNSTIQKRVSRVRQTFKKFLLDNQYEGMAI